MNFILNLLYTVWITITLGVFCIKNVFYILESYDVIGLDMKEEIRFALNRAYLHIITRNFNP